MTLWIIITCLQINIISRAPKTYTERIINIHIMRNQLSWDSIKMFSGRNRNCFTIRMWCRNFLINTGNIYAGYSQTWKRMECYVRCHGILSILFQYLPSRSHMFLEGTSGLNYYRGAALTKTGKPTIPIIFQSQPGCISPERLLQNKPITVESPYFLYKSATVLCARDLKRYNALIFKCSIPK